MKCNTFMEGIRQSNMLSAKGVYNENKLVLGNMYMGGCTYDKGER